MVIGGRVVARHMRSSCLIDRHRDGLGALVDRRVGGFGSRSNGHLHLRADEDNMTEPTRDLGHRRTGALDARPWLVTPSWN